MRILLTIAMFALAFPSFAEEVYMIRGFGGIWSKGMNEMAERMQAEGINASHHSDGDVTRIANDIIERAKTGDVSYPIIISGHSIGGNSIVRFANKLGNEGIPVALVIGVDPGFPKPPKFKKGARKVKNYRIPSGHDYEATTAYSGLSINNIEVEDVSHTEIDDDPETQDRIIADIKREL